MTLLSRPFNRADGILIDTSSKLTLATAKGLWALGVRGVWRYVFFSGPRVEDLDRAELFMLLGLGFWVGAVQHVPFPSWHADGPTGALHAQAAVANAAAAGYVTPSGCHPIALCLDAEGVGNPGADMVAYARAGFQVRTARTYQPVGYNGFDCGLRGGDLDALNADASCGGDLLEWWCDFAPMGLRPKPAKGYAGHQRAQTTMAGTGVDVDDVLRDGAIYGLVDGDINVEGIDPREAPTVPEIPLPFDPTSVPPPPPDKS